MYENSIQSVYPVICGHDEAAVRKNFMRIDRPKIVFID